MGWFGSSSSSSPSSSPSSSSSSSSSSPADKIAPNRSQRARCWEARDSFFQCLDSNNILDPIKEAPAAHSKCDTQEASFEKECVGSWVEYFKKRRVMEHKRESMLKNLEAEGAKPMQLPNPVGQTQEEP